ncbi:hypothetical protein [Methylobacterium oryzihabitans]|uniref:hypothetical protein n=1 Tax=Methylobacterium oryzihabitans TaxID=2499852 RepID=UPI0016527ABF|nr:hypothetical protein [Methylobacterium oryzihabitans]
MVSALHAAGWSFVHEDVIPATGQSHPTVSAASSAVGSASVALIRPTHPDDVAVDAFAAATKAEFARSREKGRGGWNDAERCSVESLAAMLNEHVLKGDPVDVANFATMLHHRGGRTGPDAESKALRGLAWVLDAHLSDGAPSDHRYDLVTAPLGRVYPDRVHTVERCGESSCRAHGCDECPTDAQWRAANDRLTAWLARDPNSAPAGPRALIVDESTPLTAEQLARSLPLAPNAVAISAQPQVLDPAS